MEKNYSGGITMFVVALVIGVVLSWWFLPSWHHYQMARGQDVDDHHHAMMGHHSHEHDFDLSGDEARAEYLVMRDAIAGDQREHGNYACCLEKPCTYCLEKTPKHGEGSACTCLEDIMNGVHPCGECIGEIMEGHGNKFLSKYFAPAIAEEMGEHHLAALEQMMSEKYPQEEE